MSFDNFRQEDNRVALAMDLKNEKRNAMWIKISEEKPPEGKVVSTKIDDKKGVRKEAKLIRRNNLYFTSDMKMYVYYTPTHWEKYDFTNRHINRMDYKI